MNLVITAEHHFVQSPDGRYWGPDTMTYRFWARYLDVFDQVSVAARVRSVSTVSSTYTRLDGPGVTVHAIPEYVGPRAYLRVRRSFQRAARSAASADDAVLLRVGCSPLAAELERQLVSRHQPFGVEVITDPFMVFAPGAIRHPMRPLWRRMFTHQLRRQCRRSVAATYVTRSSLQQRYPTGPTSFRTSYSDVDLPPVAFVDSARSGGFVSEVPTIVSVGSMAQLYKGFDVLIDAVARCVADGLPVHLVLIGDGKHRPEFEQQVRRLGLQGRVTFTGQLAGGAAIRDQLDKADLFVLASRTEGLPRAMIEAQARGLPCIGTSIGGIPELLSDENLVPPDDPVALANRIRSFLNEPELRARESARNLATAQSYAQERLAERRIRFLQELRDRTMTARHHPPSFRLNKPEITLLKLK
ncbi:MAG: glycosyltransferase [Thermomicrobiales bacterium]